MVDKSLPYISAYELLCLKETIFSQGRVKYRYQDNNTEIWYTIREVKPFHDMVILKVKGAPISFKVTRDQWLAVDWYEKH